MPDRNAHAFGRLICFAQLTPHARDEAERREFLAECQAALGVLEAEQREPLPPHISRDLWPAQGAAVPDDAAWRTAVARAWVAGRPSADALFDESEDLDLSGCAEDGPEWVPHFRTTIEAGAGFAPGELAPGAAEDGTERVMQAAETWWGQRG